MELNIESIKKDKLRKGFSYPIKTKDVEYLFKDFEINQKFVFRFRNPNKTDLNGSTIIKMDFWLPNQSVTYERFYLDSISVNSDISATIREQILQNIFPQLKLWVKKVVSLNDNSTYLKLGLFYSVKFLDGDLRVETNLV